MLFVFRLPQTDLTETDLKNLLVDNEVQNFDPVAEAFKVTMERKRDRKLSEKSWGSNRRDLGRHCGVRERGERDRKGERGPYNRGTLK
jgi:hypothetical protein